MKYDSAPHLVEVVSSFFTKNTVRAYGVEESDGTYQGIEVEVDHEMSSLEIQLSLITLIGQEKIPLPQDCLAWTVWRCDPPGQRTVRLSPMRQDIGKILNAVTEADSNSDKPELRKSVRRKSLILGTANARLKSASFFGCNTDDQSSMADLFAVGVLEDRTAALEAAAILVISAPITFSQVTILDAERLGERGWMMQRDRYWAVAWTP